MRRAVFLDRDGTVNATVWNEEEQLQDSPYTLDEFVLLPRVTEAICRLNELGLLSVVVSNQPGIAKGKCAPEFIAEAMMKMQAELARAGARLDGVYYCLHHPQATVPEYLAVCDCRKPKAGLLLEAARDLKIDLGRSFMVGDQERDVEAGHAAGCRCVLIGATADKPSAAEMRAPDLYAAVELLAALEAVARVSGTRVV